MERDVQLVNFVMNRATARRFLVAANERGLSRSALLRQMVENFLDVADRSSDD